MLIKNTEGWFRLPIYSTESFFKTKSAAFLNTWRWPLHSHSHHTHLILLHTCFNNPCLKGSLRKKHYETYWEIDRYTQKFVINENKIISIAPKKEKHWPLLD